MIQALKTAKVFGSWSGILMMLLADSEKPPFNIRSAVFE